MEKFLVITGSLVVTHAVALVVGVLVGKRNAATITNVQVKASEIVSEAKKDA